MERIVEQAFLYDFYGELLTQHQRQVYEDFVLNNLSFTEIAEERGISRQGVHDLVKRCDRLLSEYESKLHLVEKFLDTRQKISQIHELISKMEARGCTGNTEQSVQIELEQIKKIAENILENL